MNTNLMNQFTREERAEIDSFVAKYEYDLKPRENNRYETLMQIAARQGRLAVVKFLVQAENDKVGCAVLHKAVDGGHIEVAKYLVSMGADINAKDGDCKTPLDWAKEKNNTEMVEYLESVGAKSE